MNPEEKSRAATSCSDTLPAEPASETLCWLAPKFPKAVRSRISVPSGGVVMMLTAPATASEPYMVEPEPRNTSTREGFVLRRQGRLREAHRDRQREDQEEGIRAQRLLYPTGAGLKIHGHLSVWIWPGAAGRACPAPGRVGGGGTAPPARA